MSNPKIGIWFIGAKGGVAATAITGFIALQKQLIEPIGLVSQLPQFANLGLSDWNQFIIGGHEIRNTTLYDEALQMVNQSRAIDANLLEQCKEDLAAIDKNICAGTLLNVGNTICDLADTSITKNETAADAISRIQTDLKNFVKQYDLEHVVMVNIASTEPPMENLALPESWNELEKQLSSNDCPLPASSLYAIAALDLSYSYINFTPSIGSAPPAICDLAKQRKAGHMGHDGKTGETLMKSALAPMFAMRNLQVMSWVGHNIFGNMDAKVLDDPENKQTKVTSKDRLLSQIFGYTPQTLVSIENIESMGDWKTAWDHIHFQGFLGTPMTLQFTWQGCDSILAAPLVLDLILFAERAWRNGDSGLLTFLSSFFKSPVGVEENSFVHQFQMLEEWAQSLN